MPITFYRYVYTGECKQIEIYSPPPKKTLSNIFWCYYTYRWNFQYILPIAKEKRTFTLIGYSYGSLIAIELVKRLEDHGLNGQLVLIDGAPKQMKAMIEQYIPSSTQEELQNNILFSVIDILRPAVSEKVNFAFI